MKDLSKMLEVKCDCSETIDWHELKDFQGGLKSRDDSDYEKMKTSLLKYGWSFVMYYWNDGKTKWILDGHNRKNVLQKLEKEGYFIPPLPAIEVYAKDKAEAKQKLLRLNSQYGKMSRDSVLEFAEDIDLNFDEIALPDSVIDFTDQSGEIAETEGDDEAPEVDEKSEPVSKRGEMYELGNSILMCGDSTSAEDVARLMGGEKADISFCSPPYGVIDGNIRQHYVKGKPKESNFYNEYNDDMSNWLNLMNQTTQNILNSCEQVFINVQMLADNKHDFFKWINNFNDNIVDIIIWNKPAPPQMQKNILNNGFEFIIIFDKQQNSRTIRFGNFHGNESNVIEVKKEQNKFADVHKAVFSVSLVEKILEINSKSRSVLDLFGGTGTTLIACEKNNRNARIMEIDPLYCDVIRKRYTKWAKENGKPITSGCLE